MKTVSMIMMTLAAGAAQPVLAHTELAGTVPADRAVVATAPEDLQLRFSEPVRLTALSVRKDGAAKQSLGPLPTETTGQFTVALPALDEGHYVVSWRALSEDSHVMSGEFMFVVGATDGHDEHMNGEPAHAGEHSGHMEQDRHDDHGAAH